MELKAVIKNKFVIVGIIIFLGLLGLIFWSWYNGGVTRDAVRLSHGQKLINFFKAYQNQFATLPIVKNWFELVALDNSLKDLQDPKTPSSFYVYCQAEDRYLLALKLERLGNLVNQKNLASGLALNNCLTSNGVAIKSLQCSVNGQGGEINGITGNILCLGLHE